MVDAGSIGGIVLSYTKTSAFWISLVILLLIVVVFFYGYFNRRSKLKYNCLEVVRFGNGKVGVNKMKAGFMKTKSFLGMFDYGRESLLKTSDGRVIEKGRTSQLHDIFGKKGFIVGRHPRDNRLLVPINKVDFENLGALLSIAPGEYRDASVRIYREAVDETKGTWDKILPYIMVGLCIFLCIITIVIAMQIVNHATDSVGKLLIQGCTNQANVQPSVIP